MKKYFIISSCMALVGFIFVSHPAIAQEVNEPAAVTANDNLDAGVIDINYSYGIVTNISPAEITLLEYDYDRDEEIQVTYKIDAETEFNNLDSIDKVVKSDEIEIYYVNQDGVKLAKSIEKEELTIGEEDLIGGTYDDSAEDIYLEEIPVDEVEGTLNEFPGNILESTPAP